MDGEREEIGLGKTRHTQVVSYKSRIRCFHEWIHTLEDGPQWWERPCASHPGHGLRHYTLVESNDSEYQAVGRNLQTFSPRRN